MITLNLKKTINKLLIKLNRLRLRNPGFTLIANNCNGGIIYHSLGEKFTSPTINLFFNADDYFIFLENLEEALKCELTEVAKENVEEDVNYPIGMINLRNGKTIHINFMHYKSFNEAKNKWEERCERVNMDNLFILMELGQETTKDYVERFERLDFKNKVVITNQEFPSDKSSLHIDIYGANYRPGLMVRRIPGTFHKYIELFDYIHWLNTGNIRRAKFYKKFIQ